MNTTDVQISLTLETNKNTNEKQLRDVWLNLQDSYILVQHLIRYYFSIFGVYNMLFNRVECITIKICLDYHRYYLQN